jgi:hypothetical protein
MKKIYITLVVGCLIGLTAGGFLFHNPAQTILTEKLVQSTVTRVEFREVKIREVITATEAHVTEVRHTDGTITLDSHFYGLGIDKQTQVTESVSLTETSKTEDHVMQVAQPSWTLGFGFYADPANLMDFDFRRQWILSASRRIGDSPFHATLFGGPRILGLGFTAEF